MDTVQTIDTAKTVTCIMCPLGCQITATRGESSYICVGQLCKRGITYTQGELTAPVRVVTSLMPHVSGAVIPCKTRDLIPKSKIFDVLKQIKKQSLQGNVKMGDVLIQNVCQTGSDVVATAEFYLS